MYEGKITYHSEEAGETGREYFNVSVENDGTRTLRSVCEMDQVNLIRDVTYTVDKDFRAEGEAFSVAEGRVTQRLECNGRVRLFGTHPIVIDIWKCVHVKAENPGRLQVLDGCMNCPPVTNGASAPLLAYKRYDMYYQGRAKVTVPAGTFDCEHFDWKTGNGRTLQLYTAPGDWLPVRVVVPEGKRFYQLAELRETRR
jgi:hypothetical protein